MRLTVAIGASAILLLSAIGAPAQPSGAAQPSPTYSESFMIDATSPDGTEEIAVRLERFPARGVGTLWVMAFFGDQVYSVVQEDVPLDGLRGRVPVESSDVAVAVTGPVTARFERTATDAALTATVRAAARAHATTEPPLGPGSLPLTVEARFEAWHRPVNVRIGRSEVMGSVHATIRTPAGVRTLEVPGNWHEQVGERARFGPRFTYLTAQGPNLGLLAVQRAETVYGYAWLAGQVAAVRAFTIDPIGLSERTMRVELENGQVIAGKATVKRLNSIPIEGQRRPGSTIVLTTNVGTLAGHLNDWQPRD
jgi:hypothetical protein